MIAVELKITVDTATPALQALGAALEPQNVLPVFGRSVTNTVRDHFDELEADRPNKLGGARTHYYSGARAGTKFVVDGEMVTVGISQVGIRFRYFGGTIRAGQNPSSVGGKPTKYLTIPATAESYGHRAADFPDMVVLWGKSGPFALARQEKKTIAIADSYGTKTLSTEILFWLRETVEGAPDKTMLPDDSEIRDSVTRDFNRYVKTVWRTRNIPRGE
jgi:hypothetical protein